MKNRSLISFDYAIKYLLKDKQDYEIVEGFISAVLSSQGYAPVKITALLESESNRELPELKRSIADLIVKDAQGHQYVVEIDHEQTDLYLNKACFNASRLIVDNIQTGQDYSHIEKIFHINLLYFPFIGTSAPLQHGKVIFHAIERGHKQHLELTDLDDKLHKAYNIFPEYFVISVPLFNDVVSQELDEWLYLMKHSAIPEDFKSPYMKKVAERLSLLKMTSTERAEYDHYLNRSLKERDYLVTAEDRGLKKGLKQGKALGLKKGEALGLQKGKAIGLEEGEALGLQKGKAMGLKEGKTQGGDEKAREIALNLLKAKLSPDAIAAATGLSLETIQELDQSLNYENHFCSLS